MARARPDPGRRVLRRAAATPSAGGESEVLGDADEGIDGVQAIRVYYADPVHVEGEGDVDYELRPPAGGMHRDVWWNCGFYDEPIVDENAVHDLEHGAVWLAYAPDLDDASVEVLHELARAERQGPGGALRGSGRRARPWWPPRGLGSCALDSVDDPRLAEFVDAVPERLAGARGDATCSGTNLGTPIP